MKNEPDEYSIDHALAAPQATIAWDGVRNYQARNLLRDEIQRGDGVLFYHSNTRPMAIVGLCRVVEGG